MMVMVVDLFALLPNFDTSFFLEKENKVIFFYNGCDILCRCRRNCGLISAASLTVPACALLRALLHLESAAEAERVRDHVTPTTSLIIESG